MNSLNIPITLNETEAIIKSFPPQNSPGPKDFSIEFYKHFQKELMPILHKLFHTIEAEGTLPNSIYEARDSLTPKPHKTQLRKRITGQSPS